jgi:hypothetical protein
MTKRVIYTKESKRRKEEGEEEEEKKKVPCERFLCSTVGFFHTIQSW